MFYHWNKQKALQGRCGDMGGFTRLCATKGGQPDGLESEIPSLFIPQASPNPNPSLFIPQASPNPNPSLSVPQASPNPNPGPNPTL
jgi:hypothetical protein